MGTEVYRKSYLPGYYSMRNLDEDSNSSSWPLFYGDKTLTNGQYCNGFMPRTVTDTYPGYDRDALKQKMLEHEAIFRNQVYELHRLYRTQRDMMEEIKEKELHKHRTLIETSSSSRFLVSQMPSEDARKWHTLNFPFTNSGYARPRMSGAEISNSPLSSRKENSAQAGQVPSQNGCISKDCAVLESRPSKVRKKLFDLQLPAEEYIDTEEGEQVQVNKISPENSVKFFLGGSTRTNCNGEASTSNSCLRSSIGLADLNEPVQAEEETVPISVDLLGNSAQHGEIRGLNFSSKPKSDFLGLPNETLHNSRYGGNNGTFNKLRIEDKGNRREWLSYMYEAGHSKGERNSIPLQPDKLPIAFHPTQGMLNKAHQHQGAFPNDHTMGDLWRERTGCDLEISNRSRDRSSYNHLESVVASHTPSSYPYVNTPYLANSLSRSVSSWGKPTSCFTQKLTSVHNQPSLNSSAALNWSSQSSSPSHGLCGDKRPVNGSSKSNLGLQTQNGFYQGSSFGSKEPSIRCSSIGFDYQNCNRGDNVASERSIIDGSEKYFKDSNFMELKSTKDMNSSLIFSKSSCNETVFEKDLEIIGEKRKCEDHLAVLPWLRGKLACKNEDTVTRRDSNSVDLGFFQTSSSGLFCKSETMKDLNQSFIQNVISSSSESDIEVKKEIDNSLSNRKILGFPIFEKRCASKTESSSLVSTSSSLNCPLEGENTKNEGENIVIDINEPYNPLVLEYGKQIVTGSPVVGRVTDTKVTCFRNHIDLNLCVIEDEDPLAPPVASSSVKVVVEIDLEAPAFPETEDDILAEEEQKQCELPLQSPQDKEKELQSEIVRIAAEALVTISSSDHHHKHVDDTCHLSEASLAESSLLWFVEVVSSCADDLESKFSKESKGRDSSSDKIDYFEAMTLRLTEMKEEDYMPTPLVPKIQEVEETGDTSLQNRTRKGARRGRPRRDFQRDILPGLASLSRHEVTEDLQAFGGIMKATGHSWNSGLTRRNGSRNRAARGRWRSVVDTDTIPSAPTKTICAPLMQQLNNIDAVLKDRSLTGWGKTTRRPRQQRCPAGNPPLVRLT